MYKYILTICIFLLGNQVYLAQTNQSFTLQVASTNEETAARDRVAQLSAAGHTAYYVRAEIPGKGTWYRIRVGRFLSAEEAKNYSRSLIGNTFVTTYDGPINLSFSKVKDKKTSDIIIDKKITNNLPPKINPHILVLPETTNDKISIPIKTKEPIYQQPQIRSLPQALHKVSLDIPISNPIIQSEIKGWQQQSSPTKRDLLKVFFIDSQFGWAAGIKGTLLHTEDGGKTWSEQKTKIHSSISDLFFIDRQNGWALAGGTFGITERNLLDEQILLTTTDGGLTWEPISGIDAICIYFVDKNTGYATGSYGAVLKTINGGKIWENCSPLEGTSRETSNIPDSTFVITNLQFFTSEYGWVLGNFYQNGFIKPAGLFLTRDGGKTWSKSNLPLTPSIAELVNFHFFDASHGYLTAESYNKDECSLTIYSTTDGGKSWFTKQTSRYGYQLTSLVNNSVGWVTENSRMQENGPIYEMTLLRTDDGGSTWQEELSLPETKLYSMFFINEKQGWAVGQNGIILCYKF